jgi:hypothetical protein
MKINQITIALLIIFLVHSKAQELPDLDPITGELVELKATVKVIGEDGLPIAGADAHVRVLNLERYKDGSNDFKGITNEKGEFTVQSNTSDSFIPISVKMEGFYSSEIKYQYPYELNKNIKLGEKLQPWNPTIPITLKKIGKAAPMYARTDNREARYFPGQNLEYGYDLILDDWVAPNGKGITADLMLKSELSVKNADSFHVKIIMRFPNKGDGWMPISKLEGVESELKYPREAPMTGYRDEPMILSADIHRHPSELPPGGHPYGYFFRTRTKLDQNGKVVFAIYSKIIDSNLNPPIDTRRLKNPILFGGSPEVPEDKRIKAGCFFALDYYLNPKPNDRTLEFDRKTNLATESERPASNLAP